jgi:hypothetical protein
VAFSAALCTAVLLAELAGTALLAAAALDVRSLSRFLLAAYVAYLTAGSLLVTALSPARLVTRAGLLVGALVLLLASGIAWSARGRPRPSLPRLPRAPVDPLVLALGAVVAASVAYELVLVIGAPPNNWDSLTYHLTRVAAWAQEHRVGWVPNAPTDRINEFQPLAEEQILLVTVAAGGTFLFALPQFVAQAAIAVSVYALAAAHGVGRRAAAFAALAFCCLPLVALEATTAQNDLVAASLVAAAVALVAAGGRVDARVAGVAAGLAPGVKLTTAYTLPIVALVALRRGRLAMVGVFAAASFAALSSWSFVLNVAHTGHVLGHGVGRVAQQATPSVVGSTATLFRVVYGLLDLSGLDLRMTDVVAAAALVPLALALVRRRQRAAFLAAAVVLALPRAIPPIAHVVKIAIVHTRLPLDDPASTGGPFFWNIDYGASEDLSAFGAVAGPFLLLASLIALTSRRWKRWRAPAFALPLFLVLLALTSKYNPWLARFLIVPVAIAAPFLALLWRRRAVAVAAALVLGLQLVLVHVRNEQKPLRSAPWHRSQAAALTATYRPAFAAVVSKLDRIAPRGSLGAVIGYDDPGLLLFGRHLERHVVFLARLSPAAAASRAGIDVVVFNPAVVAARAFARSQWVVRRLGGAWLVATRR